MKSVKRSPIKRSPVKSPPKFEQTKKSIELKRRSLDLKTRSFEQKKRNFKALKYGAGIIGTAAALGSLYQWNKKTKVISTHLINMLIYLGEHPTDEKAQKDTLAEFIKEVGVKSPEELQTIVKNTNAQTKLLEQNAEEIKKLGAEINNYKQQADNVTKQLNLSKNELIQRKAIVDKLRNDKKVQTQKLEESEKNTEKLSRDIENLRREKEKANEEFKIFKQDAERYYNEYNKQKQLRIGTLERTIDETIQNKDNELRYLYNAATERISELERTIQNKDNELKDAKEKHDVLLQNYNQLLGELQKADIYRSQAEAAFVQLNATIQNLESKITELTNRPAQITYVYNDYRKYDNRSIYIQNRIMGATRQLIYVIRPNDPPVLNWGDPITPNSNTPLILLQNVNREVIGGAYPSKGAGPLLLDWHPSTPIDPETWKTEHKENLVKVEETVLEALATEFKEDPTEVKNQMDKLIERYAFVHHYFLKGKDALMIQLARDKSEFMNDLNNYLKEMNNTTKIKDLNDNYQLALDELDSKENNDIKPLFDVKGILKTLNEIHENKLIILVNQMNEVLNRKQEVYMSHTKNFTGRGRNTVYPNINSIQ